MAAVLKALQSTDHIVLICILAAQPGQDLHLENKDMEAIIQFKFGSSKRKQLTTADIYSAFHLRRSNISCNFKSK